MKNTKFKITPEIDSFISSYVEAIEERTAAVFAGAGLSIPAGFVDWKKLLKKIASEIGLNIDKENDLIAVAQYHVNEKRGRHGINQALVNEFTKKASRTENHQILARLPISTFWTTNYDNLIENELKLNGKTPDIKISSPNLATNIPLRDALVYKMHGDVSQPDEAVLTKDDYENYNGKRQLFTTALQGDLLDKTFLFVGFSFSDPNIEYILSRIRVLLGKDQRKHYCIMRKVQRKDFKTPGQFTYARTLQTLQVNDLKRFAIEVIFVNDYREITTILRLIEFRVKRKRIFISGSAEIYDPYKPEVARKFIHDLSLALVKNGFEIVTGFGLGVGDAVINGALDHVYSTEYRNFNRFLIMRPFPQFSSGSKTLKELWTEYRGNILDDAGIALFLFGNKKQDDKIVLANGLQEEFDIALTKGLPVIPIGATGYKSKDLYNQLINKKEKYPWRTGSFSKDIKNLNKESKKLDSNIPKILKIIKRLQTEGI